MHSSIANFCINACVKLLQSILSIIRIHVPEVSFHNIKQTSPHLKLMHCLKYDIITSQ